MNVKRAFYLGALTLLSVFIFIAGLSFALPSRVLKKQHEDVKVNASIDLKLRAYEILKAKCNVCHRYRNPFRVFSMDNMDEFAEDINEQVFVKKRMPKGKEIQLTPSEYELLRKWLVQAR